MKKKLLIGALGLASVFTMSSFEGDSSSETAARRPMFGQTEGYLSDCSPSSTNPDGSQMCKCVRHYTQYIFWIGFEASHSEFAPCGSL